ncbi:hypothetical protein K502DRAFT_349731 [Neoconidiobolus thromboides FSU 785]|nr:hypothetical protein K502DRAFT_349731 [Neoconidiobolus thromboides FSU 785]
MGFDFYFYIALAAVFVVIIYGCYEYHIYRKNKKIKENPATLNNTIVLCNTEIPIYEQNREFENEEWAFYITVNLNEKVLASEQDKLYFVNTSIIQANNYFTNNSISGYFEVELLSLEPKYNLNIGLSLLTMDLDLMEDSSVYLNCNKGKLHLYGKEVEWIDISLEIGDTIGCLYLPTQKQVLFTKNGHEIGILNYSIGLNRGYPTIKATKGTFIQFNFGKMSFKYLIANQHQFNLVSPFSTIEIPPQYS